MHRCPNALPHKLTMMIKLTKMPKLPLHLLVMMMMKSLLLVVMVKSLLLVANNRELMVRGRGPGRDKWWQEMVGIRPPLMQKMSRNRRTGKQMVIRGITTTCASIGGDTLHPLEIESVFLQMASNILSGQSIHTHECHYGLWDSVLDP